TRLATLDSWMRSEPDPAAVAAILESLREHPADQTRDLLETLIGDRAQTVANRQAALVFWVAGLDEASGGRLLALAGSLEDGPVLAAVLRQIGTRRALPGTSVLIDKLNSSTPELRAAAVEALMALNVVDAGESLRELLN